MGDDSPSPAHRRPRALTRAPWIQAVYRAVTSADDASVEAAVLRLSSRRRIFAPLAVATGAITMLFAGLRLLFSNWRLTLIQVLPAMLIWVAMFDLKVHVFHGKSFHPLHGWVLLLAIASVALVTAAAFYLNAVFAFAIANPGRPQIRPGFRQARIHRAAVIGSGFVLGAALGVAALDSYRWGRGWFAITMSVMIGVLMVTYVAVPTRLTGLKAASSRSDKLKASAVGGALGGLICLPPYGLGRVGVLMLGSRALLVPGIILLAFASTLQAGATGAIRTVKTASRLVAHRQPLEAPTGPSGEESERDREGVPVAQAPESSTAAPDALVGRARRSHPQSQPDPWRGRTGEADRRG
jgi:uncharacterized membrane protein